MNAGEPVRIFVAHTFDEHEDFHKVIEYVEAKDSFVYLNTANINAKPEGGEPAIQEELRKQIGLAEIVIVPVNIYKADPDLIDYQIRVAENFKTPVLGIRPFGGENDVPRPLAKTCNDFVEWESRRIVTAIKRLARNEQIGEYEVIEFTLD